MTFLMTACQRKMEQVVELPSPVFEEEVSYTISRTGTGESEEVKATGGTARYGYNVYPVLNISNEKDILFQFYPDHPEDIEVISRLGFGFIISVPASIFELSDTSLNATLIDPLDYPIMLLDDDDENGRRVCFTKEGTNADGSLFIDNACASEGWYGDAGSFEFEFTHHELFYDADGQPNIYTEGTFEAMTEPIDTDDNDRFVLSDGSFKLIIPLIF